MGVIITFTDLITSIPNFSKFEAFFIYGGYLIHLRVSKQNPEYKNNPEQLFFFLNTIPHSKTHTFPHLKSHSLINTVLHTPRGTTPLAHTCETHVSSLLVQTLVGTPHKLRHTWHQMTRHALPCYSIWLYTNALTALRT